MPARNATLSFVPNCSIAYSFNHAGVRSMNSDAHRVTRRLHVAEQSREEIADTEREASGEQTRGGGERSKHPTARSRLGPCRDRGGRGHTPIFGAAPRPDEIAARTGRWIRSWRPPVPAPVSQLGDPPAGHQPCDINEA